MGTNIKMVEFSSYVAPAIVENPRLDWVEYGDDNNYYQYLIDRRVGSATNNAVITGIADMIYGKGLDASNSASNPAAYLELKRLLSEEDVYRFASDVYWLGNGALQVLWNADKSAIAEITHMPVQTLRAEKCDEDGKINAYYYAWDWTRVRNRSQVTRIGAFGMSTEKREIYFYRPYAAGSYYYSPPRYMAALPYAELEEEVANYHINNIKNGLAPSMIINFNNGIPPQEEQDNINSTIGQKWQGSNNAGRWILAFNDDANKAATIEPVELSEAHLQYEFLSRESSQKIMVGHRVTSPMLFGIKENSGLGSNADEIKNAYLLMDNTVIRPIQLGIIGALDELLAANNTALKLYFKPLSPLEFNDIKVTDQQTIEEETGVKAEDQVQMMDIVKNYNEGHITKPQAVTMMVHFAKVPAEVAQTLFSEASSPAFGDWVQELIDLGEEVDEKEWELVGESALTDEDIVKMREVQFASTGRDYPNAPSKQDGVTQAGLAYKVRYAYAGEPSGEREFCSLMLGAGKVYRLEDIERMKGQSVNPGFGKGGAATYDILLYKGGPNCKHFWMRKTYLARAKGVKPDPKNPRSEVSVNELRKLGVKLPVNDAKVAKIPFDQDYRGYTKEYAQKRGIPK
jgi:capsid portal protein